VVLAAGAGCLDLWPPLARQLGISWAGVLALATNPGSNPWLRQVAKGRLVLNQQEQRLGLEDQAGWLAEERWIVDASAAPWGPKGVLVGQISLVRPLEGTRQAPDPAKMEQRLRQGLQGWDPQLAALVGTYRQIPVAFGLQGRPLVGPVPGAPGLWTFTGFRSPFSTAPLHAAQLAQSLAATLTNRAAWPNMS
jgi:glycine/D-amino acid oxidase-like deaminating enzyme